MIRGGNFSLNPLWVYYTTARGTHLWYLISLSLYSLLYLVFRKLLEKATEKTRRNIGVGIAVILILTGNIFFWGYREFVPFIKENTFWYNEDVIGVLRLIFKGQTCMIIGSLLAGISDEQVDRIRRKLNVLIVFAFLEYAVESVIIVKISKADLAVNPYLPAIVLFLSALCFPDLVGKEKADYFSRMSRFIYIYRAFLLY